MSVFLAIQEINEAIEVTKSRFEGGMVPIEKYDTHTLKCLGLAVFMAGYSHGRLLVLLTFLRLLNEKGFGDEEAESYIVNKIQCRYVTDGFVEFCSKIRSFDKAE